MVRSRPGDTELEEEPEAKRQNFRVPTLFECLGIEGLHLLREEEENMMMGKRV
jgi:hypothetical protein